MLGAAASHPLSWAPAFPMAPAGGLFIAIVGVGIVIGALFPNKRDFSLVLRICCRHCRTNSVWRTPHDSIRKPDTTSVLVLVRVHRSRNHSVLFCLAQVSEAW